MHRSLARAITAAVSAFIAPGAVAQPGNEYVETRMVAESQIASPGETVRIAVVFDIEPTWHLYWRNSGDTGVPPTVDLTLPDGVVAGPMQWPAPKRYIHGDGELLDFIHEDRLTLVVPLHFDASLVVGKTLAIEADIEFLVCREACIPGWTSRTLTIALGETASSASADRAIFEAFDIAAPQPMSSAHERGVVASWTGRVLSIDAPDASSLTFFPDEPRVGGPIDTLNSCVADGDQLLIEYGETASDAGRVTGVLEVVGGEAAGRYELEVPPPPAG